MEKHKGRHRIPRIIAFGLRAPAITGEIAVHAGFGNGFPAYTDRFDWFAVKFNI
jgi:hypothetical protein